MIRMRLDELSRDLPGVIDRITSSGESVDLERDDRVVARLSPVARSERRTGGEWNDLLEKMPEAGDDAASFAAQIDAIRRLLPPAPAPAIARSTLKELFDALPDLGDDREQFARDIESARSFLLPDRDPWAE